MSVDPADGGTTHLLLAAGDPRLEASVDLAVARLAIDTVADPDPDHHVHMLGFIATNDDALLRSNTEGHLTGSALVVNCEATRFLLLLHRKIGRWLQPGGHADGDSNLAAVALREATEESGIEGLRVAVPAIDLDVHEIDAGTDHHHLHFDVRHLVVAPPGAQPIANHEALDVRWVSPEELDAYEPDESLRRLVDVGMALARRLRTLPVRGH